MHVEHFRRGRTTVSVQYWASHDKLQRLATDRTLHHAAAWGEFMRTIADRCSLMADRRSRGR